jgi:hypothetical protein
MALASAVILGFKSRGGRDHILLSQIRDVPFRRVLQLAGLLWRYQLSSKLRPAYISAPVKLEEHKSKTFLHSAKAPIVSLEYAVQFTYKPEHVG